MDATAIKEIAGLSAAEKPPIRVFPESRLVALHESMQLHDLEKFNPTRFRFRGAMKTASIADFVAYVKARKGEGYIDGDNLTAKVFFNLGDSENPGHADWFSTLALKPTAAYVALQGIDGKKLSQQEAVDFLEDWMPNAAGIGPEGEYVSVPKCIGILRKISIEAKSKVETEQGNFRGAQSAFESIEATSENGLPEGFTFTCTPYLGLPERIFKLRLSVLTESATKTPRLTLRLVKLEAEKEAIVQDFKELLIREVGDDASLTIGAFTP